MLEGGHFDLWLSVWWLCAALHALLACFHAHVRWSDDWACTSFGGLVRPLGEILPLCAHACFAGCTNEMHRVMHLLES